MARADRRGHARRRSMPPRPMCSARSIGHRPPLPAAPRRGGGMPAPAARAGAPGDREIGAERMQWLRMAAGAAGRGCAWSARWHGAGRVGCEQVERVVSPGGIEAYLISEPSIPFLSLCPALPRRRRARPGGQGRPRLHGRRACSTRAPGELDSQAFRTELEDRAIRLSFDAGRDAFTGQLKTLTRAPRSGPSSCCAWR